MKHHINHLIAILTALSVITNAQLARAMDIESYYENIDKVLADGKPETIISFMENLNKIDQISLGGGVGPIDGGYVRWQFVSIAWALLARIEQSGNAINYDELSPWTAAVLSAAAGEKSVTTEKILNLLRSDEPSLRWIGLKMIKNNQHLKRGEIEATINAILADDSFIVIMRTPIGPVQGRPSPPGLANNIFRAPLREQASALLNIELSQELVDKDGMNRLLEIYRKHPTMAGDIVEAIGMLHPHGEEIKNAQTILRKNPSLDEYGKVDP